MIQFSVIQYSLSKSENVTLHFTYNWTSSINC